MYGDDALEAGAKFCSFTPSTLVATPSGDKPIGDLKVGDTVTARDPDTGETSAQPVEAVLVHDDAVTGTVVIDGENVSTTPEHPFFSLDRGFVPAKDLRVGELVASESGDPGRVDAVVWDGGPQRMWNLTVATDHTFFVGHGGWWVHNACPVKEYETGLFDDLKGRSVAGDGLDIHHAPQDQLAQQVLPGATRPSGPSIALPELEHRAIPRVRGATNLSPRDLLAMTVRDLRNFTNAPNSAIKDLINLNKTTYPGAFIK